jgi:hypothetical protein
MPLHLLGIQRTFRSMPHGRSSSGVARSQTAERLSGFLYGTIVALSVIVAGARSFPDAPGHIAVLVVVTCAVFWLAHVYAHAIARSVTAEQRLSLAELRDVARHEAAIVEAVLPPVAALLLGVLGILSARAAIWAAFGLGLFVLAAQGLVFARVEQLGRLGTLLIVAANLTLGLLLVALKLLLAH